MPKRKRARPNKKSRHLIAKGHRPGKSPSSSNTQAEQRQRGAREWSQFRPLPVLILFLTSFLAYANAWPNELVWDDGVFAMADRLSGVSWADIGHYFTQDAWAALGIDTGLYRPLLLTSVSLDILIFGEWKAGFHLLNILFHAFSTVAVFCLIRHLLTKSRLPFSDANFAALLAAMVFAVHPIHAEVVNSVFNRSEMLVTLCVAGGLSWFLPRVEQNPMKAWGVLAVIYLLAMLSRETGIVFPAITVLTLWLTSEKDWKRRLGLCLPVLWLLIPLALYFWLRANALDIETKLDGAVMRETSVAGAEQKTPIIGLSLYFERILPALIIWFDSLKLMLWPHPLMTYHNPSDTGVWMALCLQLAVIAFAAFRAVQKKPGLLIGLMFFYLAILPASRIVDTGTVPPHLHERYLYMPSAGIAIMLGFAINGLRLKVPPRHVLVLLLTIVIILTPVTWARNAKWTSTLLLAETDINQGGTNSLLFSAYVSALLKEGQWRKAAAFCAENLNKKPYQRLLAGYCGQVYSRLRDYDKAEYAFALAMENRKGRSTIHYALAMMYLEQDRREEASEQFDLAAETARQQFMKAYLRAEALVRLYPANYDRLAEARTHMEKAIDLQPQYLPAQQKLGEIEKRMESLRRR